MDLYFAFPSVQRTAGSQICVWLFPESCDGHRPEMWPLKAFLQTEDVFGSRDLNVIMI